MSEDRQLGKYPGTVEFTRDDGMTDGGSIVHVWPVKELKIEERPAPPDSVDRRTKIVITAVCDTDGDCVIAIGNLKSGNGTA